MRGGWHATNILRCISKGYGYITCSEWAIFKIWKRLSKAWECTEMIAAHSKPRCMEYHNFGSVAVYIISACHCLAYCICCRVCLLDRQRLGTWRVCDVPWQEAGGEKRNLICVCVFLSAYVCKILLKPLSKNRPHASSGKAHNNSKASHWQRLSIAVKDCEFDKWILS